MSKAFELGLIRAELLIGLEHLKRCLKEIDDIPPVTNDNSVGSGLLTVSKKKVIEAYKEHEQELLERLKELDNEQSIQSQ